MALSIFCDARLIFLVIAFVLYGLSSVDQSCHEPPLDPALSIYYRSNFWTSRFALTRRYARRRDGGKVFYPSSVSSLDIRMPKTLPGSLTIEAKREEFLRRMFPVKETVYMSAGNWYFHSKSGGRRSKGRIKRQRRYYPNRGQNSGTKSNLGAILGRRPSAVSPVRFAYRCPTHNDVGSNIPGGWCNRCGQDFVRV